MTRRPHDPPLADARADETDVNHIPYVAFLAGRSDADYWMLVRQLMDLGWSRLGSRQTSSGRLWGFRLGYTLPDLRFTGEMAQPQERWIRAAHEQGAMRRLLRDLQRD